MRIVFVIALLSALGFSYYYKATNQSQRRKLQEQSESVEEEIRDCAFAQEVIRKEKHRLAVALSENKSLRAQLHKGQKKQPRPR